MNTRCWVNRANGSGLTLLVTKMFAKWQPLWRISSGFADTYDHIHVSFDLVTKSETPAALNWVRDLTLDLGLLLMMSFRLFGNNSQQKIILEKIYLFIFQKKCLLLVMTKVQIHFLHVLKYFISYLKSNAIWNPFPNHTWQNWSMFEVSNMLS